MPSKSRKGAPKRRKETDEDALVAAAVEMMERAYAPYSGFHVGAALRTADGQVVTGCNVENAAYGLSICAERTAIARAVAEGHTHFDAIVVATRTSPPSPPCGQCLQTMVEFEPDLTVILANPSGERARLRLGDLLPVHFRKQFLVGEGDEGT